MACKRPYCPLQGSPGLWREGPPPRAGPQGLEPSAPQPRLWEMPRAGSASRAGGWRRGRRSCFRTWASRFLDTFLSLAPPPGRGACLGVFPNSGSPRARWPGEGCWGRPVRKPTQAGARNTASPVAPQVPTRAPGSWTGSAPAAGSPSTPQPSRERGAIRD